MTILNGHFNGTEIILDEPVPQGISPDTPVRVLFQDSNGAVESRENSASSNDAAAANRELNDLAIASEKCAGQTLPREDFSDWEGTDA